MRRNRNIITITSIVFLLSLLSLAAAGEITKFDSTYNNIDFTFGFSFSNWCEYRHAGIGDRKILLCEPEYKIYKEFTPVEINSAVERPFYYNNDNFEQFTSASMLNNFKDKVGDTVMVIWSGGKSLGTIWSIGYFEKKCSSGIACQIIIIDTSMAFPAWDDFVIVLRKGSFYSGIPAKLTEISRTDSQYTALLDSVRTISYIDLFHGFKNSISAPCKENIISFKIGSNSSDDSILFFSYCDYYSNYRSDNNCCSNYLTFKKDNKWVIKKIDSLHKCGIKFNFDSSFDLNNDGNSEFLVTEEFTNGVAINIYSIIDNKWKLMARKIYFEK